MWTLPRSKKNGDEYCWIVKDWNILVVGYLFNNGLRGDKYLNDRSGQSTLILDSGRAALIAALFNKVTEGEGLANAVNWITERGLRTRAGRELSTSTASRILRNHLYKGWVEYPKWGISRRGTFDPIVSDEVWTRVQNVLNGRAATAVPHSRTNPTFPLKGIIVCSKCGKLATASISKGRTGRYAYYHCHRGAGHLSIRADKAERAFLQILEALAPEPARLCLVEAVFRAVWNQRNASRQPEVDRLETLLSQLNTRKRNVLEQMETGVLNDTDFSERYRKLNHQIADAESAISQARETELDVDIALTYLNHVLWNLHILFENSDIGTKRSICKAIFPEGIRCSRMGFGTVVTHSLFSMFGDETVSLEHLASPTGFEPVLSP